jgi:hypothetical protein
MSGCARSLLKVGESTIILCSDISGNLTCFHEARERRMQREKHTEREEDKEEEEGRQRGERGEGRRQKDRPNQ